ncbi:MAG TPA: hypothetical protein DCE41_02840 [Cytophagales bacterium]|nr:hypothetical protein [Cytophagales bacterium]HAA17803.1 hypothetical protein [Cytophagales bacterium]HAP58844.1 hypothetical protein [Cytophagales bacterium]
MRTIILIPLLILSFQKPTSGQTWIRVEIDTYLSVDFPGQPEITQEGEATLYHAPTEHANMQLTVTSIDDIRGINNREITNAGEAKEFYEVIKSNYETDLAREAFMSGPLEQEGMLGSYFTFPRSQGWDYDIMVFVVKKTVYQLVFSFPEDNTTWVAEDRKRFNASLHFSLPEDGQFLPGDDSVAFNIGEMFSRVFAIGFLIILGIFISRRMRRSRS